MQLLQPCAECSAPALGTCRVCGRPLCARHLGPQKVCALCQGKVSKREFGKGLEELLDALLVQVDGAEEILQ